LQEDWVLALLSSLHRRCDPAVHIGFDGEACEYFGIQSWDREESPGTPPPGTNQPPIVSPPPPPPEDPDSPTNALCYEVNVLRFGDNSVFGTDSDLLYTYEPDGEAGWAKISWYSEGADVNEDEIEDHVDFAGLAGLPVTGFWAVEFLNDFVGVGSSGIFSTRKCASHLQ
jgi:hypothetical protein